MNENCLARPLETQASDSTGFRSFKQIIVCIVSFKRYNNLIILPILIYPLALLSSEIGE